MVTFQEVISLILAPPFLVRHIDLIGLIFAVVLLVYFGSFTHHYIMLPLTDWIKHKSHKGLSGIQKVSWSARYLSGALATVFFILYCYFGAFFIAEYVFIPILLRIPMMTFLIIL